MGPEKPINKKDALRRNIQNGLEKSGEKVGYLGQQREDRLLE